MRKCWRKRSLRPTIMSAIRRPDVFDATIVSPVSSASSLANRSRLISSFSMIASTMRSQSATFARSVSRLPVWTSTLLRTWLNDAGFDFFSLSSAVAA